MRGLLIGSAVATFGELVLLRSPSTSPQTAVKRSLLASASVLCALLVWIGTGAAQFDPNSPTQPPGNLGSSQPGSLLPPSSVNTNIGIPSQNIPHAAGKVVSKPNIKLSPPGGGPKSDADQKGAAEKLKSLVPAIPRPQLSSGGTGDAQKIPSGVKGGPPSGSPKSDGDQQDAADKLKSLVPAIAGPRRPPGEPKRAAAKQWQAKSSKSIGGEGSPLGVGLGPKPTPPTTGEAAPPIASGESETKITARPVQARSGAKDPTPDMDSDSSGMAEEKIEIAKEKFEKQ